MFPLNQLVTTSDHPISKKGLLSNKLHLHPLMLLRRRHKVELVARQRLGKMLEIHWVD